MLPRPPGRQNPAPGVLIHPGKPNIVFLTIRTEHRRRWLADPDIHEHLRAVWMQADGWSVGDYLLMPDHLHCFCSPVNQRFSIEQWIAYWKRTLRRRHQNPSWRFQSRGWHHRLCDDESYSEKWEYVRQNPVRKGLVEETAEWPYRGRIEDLRW